MVRQTSDVKHLSTKEAEERDPVNEVEDRRNFLSLKTCSRNCRTGTELWKAFQARRGSQVCSRKTFCEACSCAVIKSSSSFSFSRLSIDSFTVVKAIWDLTE